MVGRTRYCVRPVGLVDAIPEVGGTKRPNLERVVSLRPDLVLCNQEENRREDAESLERAGLRVVSYFPRDLPGTAVYIEALGRDLGCGPAGTCLAEALRGEIDRGGPSGPPVRYAYLIWRKPWMAVGTDTFISRLLAAAGFENAIVGGERYPALSPEALGDLDVEVVLLSSEPFPFAERHRDELAAVVGCDRARVVLVDGQLLSWHGVRTINGLRYARSLRAELGTEREAGGR